MRITVTTHFEEGTDKALCWTAPRPNPQFEYNFTKRRDLVTCMNCQSKLAHS